LSQIEQYNSSLSAITTSINDLTTHIESIDARQKELTDLTKEKHK
jgi:prefoldin subunit 5